MTNLASLFEKAAVAGAVLGLVIGFTAISRMRSAPPKSALFKDQIYAQVMHDFPEPPAEGIHEIRIDFGKAARDAHDTFWGSIGTNAAVLGGGVALSAGSALGLMLSRRFH